MNNDDIPIQELINPHKDSRLSSSSIRNAFVLNDHISHPRIGVIGCGYWGSKHVRVLSCIPNVDGVTVVDHDRRARESISAAFPAVRVSSDLEAILPYIDAVVVATPPRTHTEVALKALRHGKHVFLEKPLATSLAEARLLVEEAQEAGLVLMVGHTFEFNPAIIELKQRIMRGELGRVYYMHSSRRNLGLYRSDVNVVWDLAPHDVSIMNSLLGSVPSAVSAWGSTIMYPGIEDLAYIRLQYQELGVTGYIHVSWLDPNKVREVIVVGSKKMAIYDDLREERLRIFDRGVDRSQHSMQFERPLSYRYGDIVSPHIQFEEPLALEMRHFVECVSNGSVPHTDGRSGLAVVAVLEAIDEALATGNTVEVRYPLQAIFPKNR
ncbi:Gfo/Idh/MocA family protein [Microvirga sp. P5_D2]